MTQRCWCEMFTPCLRISLWIDSNLPISLLISFVSIVFVATKQGMAGSPYGHLWPSPRHFDQPGYLVFLVGSLTPTALHAKHWYNLQVSNCCLERVKCFPSRLVNRGFIKLHEIHIWLREGYYSHHFGGNSKKLSGRHYHCWVPSYTYNVQKMYILPNFLF